jgi:hypothetical protein
MTQGNPYTGSNNLDIFSQKIGGITGATNAAPIVVTSTGHGLVTGTKIIVSGVVGNTAANGVFKIVVIDANTFSLTGSIGNGGYSSGGTWQAANVQGSMYCPGPHKTNRELHDGDQFTDCNYWKRFAQPALPAGQAFIEVVSDDGTVYEDGVGSGSVPRVYTLTVTAGTTYTLPANIINVLTDMGGPANFTQITSDQNCHVMLNGVATALLPITANVTQIFNSGDLAVTNLAFDNSASGAVTAHVVVVISASSVCNS